MDWQWVMNDGRYGGEGVEVSSEGVVSDVMASVPSTAAADSGKGARVTPGEYYIEGDEQKQVSGINLQKGDTKAAEWMKRAEDEEK